MWTGNQITDMVDMTVNDDELVRKLIFTNVKKRKVVMLIKKIAKVKPEVSGYIWKRFPFYHEADEEQI